MRYRTVTAWDCWLVSFTFVCFHFEPGGYGGYDLRCAIDVTVLVTQRISVYLYPHHSVLCPALHPLLCCVLCVLYVVADSDVYLCRHIQMYTNTHGHPYMSFPIFENKISPSSS